MKAFRFRRPSPALVLAIAAVVVSTAGSATAAGVLVSSSSQVKPHTIQLSDLSAGAVKKLRGQRGLRGVTGTNGTSGVAGGSGATGAAGATGGAGATGATGPTGPIGPSDVFDSVSSSSLPVTGSQTVLRTLSLPAGRYVLHATGLADNNESGISRLFNCQLTAEAATYNFAGNTVSTGPDAQNDRAAMTLVLAHEFASPGTATFSCSTTATSAVVSGSHLHAIKVGAITTQ